MTVFLVSYYQHQETTISSYKSLQCGAVQKTQATLFIADVLFSNVSFKAVHVRPTRPAYWEGYIVAIVVVAISTFHV